MDQSAILKEIDSISADAFAIASNRSERYNTPPTNRAQTPVAPGLVADATVASIATLQTSVSLLNYFERMKTPSSACSRVDTAESTASEEQRNTISTPSNAKPAMQWGRLRTVVAVSAALDPDKTLKRFQVGKLHSFSVVMFGIYSD